MRNMHTKTYTTLLSSLLCLFLHFSASYAGIPGDSKGLFLNSKGEQTDSSGLKWEDDTKYIVSGDKSNVKQADYQDPSLPSGVPFMSARLFTSETKYELPVANGTKRVWLRLYFYPSSYPNFNISNSFFSVNAGGITLLNNFSASITAEALSQAYIMREYYLLPPSDKATLDVTFKPSQNYTNSFAFVNGIEMITSPEELFVEDPTLVGLGSSSVEDYYDPQTMSVNTNNMQTMYRLNVGGQYIAPSNDSGNLLRSWYDDTPYLFGSLVGIDASANFTIRYGKLPSYVAPLQVYETCRSMGPDGELNTHANLTWTFMVDPNFSYIVRFHWCDFDATRLNQRVFNMFLNNQTAQNAADVFAWTRKRAAPTKKDYVVYVRDTPGDDQLRVDLGVDLSEKPEWFDALLNGLEIFKINDAKSNLAGPNPTISDLMMKQQQQQRQQHEQPKAFQDKKKDTGAIIGGAAGGAAAFGLAAAIFIVAYKRKKRLPGKEIGGTNSWLPIYGNSHSSGSKSSNSGKSHGSTHMISTDAAANCRYFSLAEIKQATKNFDESNVIGVGGFGKVYKGIIDDNTPVAIKRSNPSSEQGVHEFQTEIEMLSKLRHRHLVSLIGFCEEGNEMVLVYDYMGRGTLREHLYKNNKTILTWKQRLEICIGAARGLHYLHTGAKYTIIHRDVKTTNILLDDKWVAKVSDFGLSKTGPDLNQGHVSTVVKGSFGYLDPEYFRRQQLTEKSDVYSFGVVLFEVLSARPALNPSLPKEQVSLSDWALQCHRKGCLDDIIDPHLKGKIDPECLRKFEETAIKCLSDHGTDRPSMGDVLWNLEFALQLHENGNGGRPASPGQDQSGVGEEEHFDIRAQMAMHRSTLSLESDDDVAEDAKEDDSSTNDIFSQFVNQKGR